MQTFSELSRRRFLAGGAGPLTVFSARPAVSVQPPAGMAQVLVKGGAVVEAESSTLRARFEQGFLTSLESKLTGEKFIEQFDRARLDALRLVYRGRETVDVGVQGFGRIAARPVSAAAA